MTANELRENVKDFFYKEIQNNEDLKKEYEELIQTAKGFSEIGSDYLAWVPVSKSIREYLIMSGFEVYPVGDETIISWKK